MTQRHDEGDEACDVSGKRSETSELGSGMWVPRGQEVSAAAGLALSQASGVLAP